MFFFFLLITQSFAAAPECPPQPLGLQSWLSSITRQQQSVFPCSINNDKLPQIDPPSFEAARLSTRCAKNWVVKNSNGKIETLPAGLRVIKLDSKKILYYSGNELREAEVSEEAWAGKKNCKETGRPSSKEAFIVEAEMALSLAEKIKNTSQPEFTQEILALKKKIQSLKKMSPHDFQKLEATWNQKLPDPSSTKIDRIAQIEKMVTKAYNPVQNSGKKVFDETLLVPISQEWFLSNPKIKAFYQKEWLDSNLDIRIRGGASGEGVTQITNSPTAGDSYQEMMGLLKKTQTFIEQSDDPSLSQSPEAKWLEKKFAKNTTHLKRLIFVHPETWNANTNQSPWAEFIPVDQSIGGFKSDYLTSVMIHELNVNSDRFFPQDTHSEITTSSNLVNCVQKNGIKALDQNPETIQRALGLNPQISVLYLKMILN